MAGPYSLTRCQLEALQVLHELVVEQGRQPTLDEIAWELDIASKGYTCRLLGRLEEKGWITMEPVPRRLCILHPPPVLPDVGLVFTLSTEAGGGPALEEDAHGRSSR